MANPAAIHLTMRCVPSDVHNHSTSSPENIAGNLLVPMHSWKPGFGGRFLRCVIFRELKQSCSPAPSDLVSLELVIDLEDPQNIQS